MYNTKRKKVNLPGTAPFSFQVSRVELSPYEVNYKTIYHTHSSYELYIPLSGDITYFVGQYEYNLEPGSVVLVHPKEVHQTVHNSDDVCNFFWITFASDNDDDFFSSVFSPYSEGAHISAFSKVDFSEIESICNNLIDNNSSVLLDYSNFFRLLDFISRNRVNATKGRTLSREMLTAMEYIENNFTRPISVKDLASSLFMSINTFERHFNKTYGMSPTNFILKRKLAYATALLRRGKSVKDAAYESGFKDYSQFIAKFRKFNGITPLQYKKNKHSVYVFDGLE